jgi:recombination associated protein RdgC
MPMTEGQAGDSKTPGREFLTWLWFKSEERNGMILIPGIGETEVQFVRRLVLESGDGEYSESVVCQGMHADLKEGREALRQGKKIREARLQLTRDAATWEFTFKADRFEFQSLKMPVVMDSDEEQDNRDGRVLERIYLLETVVNCMDQLFALFVALRLSETWQQEQGRMEKWLQAS